MEQYSLFDAPPPEAQPSVTGGGVNDPDAFGCCARYRQCSDAGYCVHDDKERAVHCTYRSSLEKGRIFYGKNASTFSPSAYAELKEKVDALSPVAFDRLFVLLVEFCELHRSAQRTIARNLCAEELSDLGLFRFSPLGIDFIDLCASKPLHGLIEKDADSSARYHAAQKAARSEMGSSGRKRKMGKTFLKEWLAESAPDVLERLAEPYRLVSLLPGVTVALEELYRDLCLSSFNSRVYELSPLAADSLLTPAEIRGEKEHCENLLRRRKP